MMTMISTMLAGAGFKNVSKGIADLSSSGVSPMGLMNDPNLKMFLAGAGIRDTANSMELVNPLMKMLQPPAPPPQPSPSEMSAAMQMLSAKLRPGQQGLALGPQGSLGMGPRPPMLPGPGPGAGIGQSGY